MDTKKEELLHELKEIIIVLIVEGEEVKKNPQLKVNFINNLKSVIGKEKDLERKDKVWVASNYHDWLGSMYSELNYNQKKLFNSIGIVNIV
jgi:hypothetical protein